MARWMQQFLNSAISPRSPQVDRMQMLIYRRDQLAKVEGMDVPGKADAIGMLGLYGAEKWSSGHHPENQRRRWLYYLYGDGAAE